MSYMFHYASAFDQDLGWCVGDDVFDPWGEGHTMQQAFSGTPCASTSCGVLQGDACAPTARSCLQHSVGRRTTSARTACRKTPLRGSRRRLGTS